MANGNKSADLLGNFQREVEGVEKRLAPLWAKRDKLMTEADKLRVQAEELNTEIKQIENAELVPARNELSRAARVLGGRAMSDNPTT